MMATFAQWRAGQRNAELERALARLCRVQDVVHVAVMPDAHVAEDVCVGTVTATTQRLLPAAVGSDIGCGMATLCLQTEAARLRDPGIAARILSGFGRLAPGLMHPASSARLPDELKLPLSSSMLTKLAQRAGRLEFATIGRGNHFLELQRDEDDVLWLAVHTGSRCMGPAIRRHHEALALRDPLGFAWLDASDERGRDYLADASWAARYAARSRQQILRQAGGVLVDLLHASVDATQLIETDHNHVRREQHEGRTLWVHRKGAQRTEPERLGIVPGSMGSATYHVAGRPAPLALCSAAHGAGRALARGEARKRIRAADLDAQMRGVWFDARLRDALREEAPHAYKDIGEVMRAQRDLVRIVRRLEPVLVYKSV